MTCIQSCMGVPRLVVDTGRTTRWQVHTFTPSKTPMKRRLELRAVKEAPQERVRHQIGHLAFPSLCVLADSRYTPGTV